MERLEAVLGYHFCDRRLLRCALTSPGWLNEHRHSGWRDSKALEWLGDALLYLIITSSMVDSGEAECTGASTPSRAAIVSNASLALAAERLGLWDFLYLGVGERRNNEANGRSRFLSCGMEAVLGAVHLDARVAGESAMAVAERVVRRLFPDRPLP